MPWIHFKKNRPSVEIETGTQLMKALLSAGLPVASSCRGDGVCAKCRVQILAGEKNLTSENATEAHLRERHGLERTERISCQTEVIGDITVDTSYW
jgi:2Fe-2S ferredoxin